MRTFLAIFIVFTFIWGGGYFVLTTMSKQMERAYFEGQRDYSNGDIRIRWTNDSCWVWTKSP